jgi:uncharacterized protein YbjT (DUF2867 family)
MRILLFGATGSAGGSVLKVCLASPLVTEVRAVARRPLRHTHSKLHTYLHGDFADYTAVEKAFAGVDACFFCLGISVTAVKNEAAYRTITHDYAVAAARTLRRQSQTATFHYLSGQGADPKSLFMWARVKAETDEELVENFDAVCWRPSAIDGEPSDHAPGAYKVLRPYFHLFRPFRTLYVSGQDLGLAMVYAAASGICGRIIPNTEIRDMAECVVPALA